MQGKSFEHFFIIAWFKGYEAEQLLTYELTFNLTMFTVANV